MVATAVIYNDTSEYGEGHLYGRVGSGIINAQSAAVRETGLKASVIDEHLNAWALHAGAHSFPDVGLGVGLYLPVNGNFKSYEIEHWGLRGRADFDVRSNGEVFRVRNGDPNDSNDRQLWYQIITNPENPAEWTTWDLLESGAHYGSPVAQIDDDGNTILYYHCRSDGLYRNNVKVVDNSELFNGAKAVHWSPISNKPDMGWLSAIYRDPTDNKRVTAFYFFGDVTTDTPLFVSDVNFDWSGGFITGWLGDDQKTIHNLFNNPIHYNPRAGSNGSEVAYFQLPLEDINFGSSLRTIRGIGGGSGANSISGPRVVKLSDGYYYYTGFEWHRSAGAANSSGGTSLGYGFPIWSRSKDFKHWTEPTIGPPIKNSWGFIGGFLEVDGYVYLADSEEVWRRPITPTEVDLTNFTTEVSFEIPRDNQPATGNLQAANPNGINDAVRELSGREIIIQPGLKTESGAYEFTTFDRFFITQVNRNIKGPANRLSIEFSNLWGKLDNPMRDITNFVGQFIWDDFSSGKRNQAFNYFFATDGAPTVSSSGVLTSRGIVLLTAWKGHNPDITAQFSSVTGTPRLITRYTDSSNYVYLEIIGSTLYLRQLISGSSSTIDSDSSPKLRIRWKWGQYDVWLNDDHIGNGILTNVGKNRLPGYAGFSATECNISNLHVEDWETSLTTGDLIRTALAMGDFHDVLIGSAESRAVAIVWGPQTDVNTPAAALEQLLETEKLQMAWRNGILEIGRFIEQVPIRTIGDTVIDSSEIDEAKRRPNLVSVDGNEHYWLEVDVADSKARGYMVNAYFDLPELLDRDAVVTRAIEEMKRSSQGSSPGGTTPLYFDLWRMDPVTWVDNAGNASVVRIEGFSVEINQSTTPFQRQTFDTSLFSEGSSGGLMDDGLPEDD
jgi:hypothetical protein